MESPFKDILNTNTVPSDAECQSIHDLLKDPRRQCADLTQQIARMQKALDDLTRDRDELQGFIDAHLALVSPARRLPDDLVREIFVAALPARNCVMSATEPPLLLCKISKAWRALALSTPQLWASVHIVVPSSSRLEKMTSMVDTWLYRSGALPLSLSVVLSYGTLPDTDVSTLLEAVIRFSSRWKQIHFTLPAILSFEPFSKVSPEHLPLLENVYVQAGRIDEETSESMFAFLGAPNIRSVSVSPQLAHISTPLHWGLLRHLTISNDTGAYITMATGFEILRQCAQLESCLLTIWSDPGESLPEETCRMDHMQRLCVHAGGDTLNLIPFFSQLALPKLRFLEFSGTPRLVFSHMLSSAPLVEFLTILSSLSIDFLLQALRLMPMLQELRLVENQDPPFDADHRELIDRLTPVGHADGPIICPRLRRIVLRKVWLLSDDTLLKFIQARTGPHLRDVAHLASVHVEFLRPIEIDILPPLGDLLTAGTLEVALQYPRWPTYSPSDGLVLHRADFANGLPEW